MREPVKGKTEAGRRREERARHKRQRVADAALWLFLERGYMETTIEAIARKAAVAPATVYQAFGTKQAILARILDQVNQWFTEMVKTEETKTFLNGFGGDPFINTPEAAQALFLKAIKDWGDYVRLAKIVPQG